MMNPNNDIAILGAGFRLGDEFRPHILLTWKITRHLEIPMYFSYFSGRGTGAINVRVKIWE